MVFLKMYSKYSLRSSPWGRQEVGYQSLCNGIQWGQQRKESILWCLLSQSQPCLAELCFQPAELKVKANRKSWSQSADGFLDPPFFHPSPPSNSLTVGVCRKKKDLPDLNKQTFMWRGERLRGWENELRSWMRNHGAWRWEDLVAKPLPCRSGS